MAYILILVVLSYYSPNALTRSAIFVNLSDIFVNASFTDVPYPSQDNPDSVFNRELYVTSCSIS